MAWVVHLVDGFELVVIRSGQQLSAHHVNMVVPRIRHRHLVRMHRHPPFLIRVEGPMEGTPRSSIDRRGRQYPAFELLRLKPALRTSGSSVRKGEQRSCRETSNPAPAELRIDFHAAALKL